MTFNAQRFNRDLVKFHTTINTNMDRQSMLTMHAHHAMNGTMGYLPPNPSTATPIITNVGRSLRYDQKSNTQGGGDGSAGAPRTPNRRSGRVLTIDSTQIMASDTPNTVLHHDDPIDIWNTFNNAQISALTPLLDIYIRDNSDLSLQVINLQNTNSRLRGIGNALRAQQSYGYLGLQDCLVRLQGQKPETGMMDIEVTLTLYGNSLSVFLNNNNNYLTLISPMTQRNHAEGSSLILQYGWNELNAQQMDSLNFTNAQRLAIRRQNMLINIDYQKHGFQFNEDGSFKLVVSYTGFIDSALKTLNVLQACPDEVMETYNNLAPRGVGTITSTTAAGGVTTYAHNPRAAMRNLNEKEEAYIKNFIATNHMGQPPTLLQAIAEYLRETPFFNATTPDPVRTLTGLTALKFYTDKLEEMLATSSLEKLKTLLQGLSSSMMRRVMYFSLDDLREAKYKLACAKALAAQGLDFDFNVGGAAGGPPATAHDFYRAQYTDKLSIPAAPHTFVPNAGRDCMTVAGPIAGFNPDAVPAGLGLTNGDMEQGRATPIYFYRLGDIIEQLIQIGPTDDPSCRQLQNFMESNNMYIILGTIDVPTNSMMHNGGAALDGTAAHEVSYSLYDLPIEHDTLMMIIENHFSDKARRSINPSVFIRDLFKVVEEYYLGDKLNSDPLFGRFELRTFSFSSAADVMEASRITPVDPVSQRPVVAGLGGGAPNMNGDYLSTGFFERLSLGNERVSFSDPRFMRAGRTRDLTAKYIVYSLGPYPLDISGVFAVNEPPVYYIGSANSTVKKVKFNQVMNDLMKAKVTDNIVRTRRGEGGYVIPQLYNASVDFVGNTHFVPGSMFQLYPSTVGLSEAQADDLHRTLGLAGFHVAIQVEHKIGLNGFTTTIPATINIPRT